MNDGLLRLTDDILDEDAVRLRPYAILSHTWAKEEVTFQDFVHDMGKGKAGYTKIEFCKTQAIRDGLQYFWIDTCCIDKSDAVELQTAIASMFRWYRNASKCYVFMSDVSSKDLRLWRSNFARSNWFRRGWTLQELLAPRVVVFFTVEGTELSDRNLLLEEIHEATGLPQRALLGTSMDHFSVEERLSWTEARTTTRKEDLAYSLLGMFDIQMPLFYGEGEERAFRRLRMAIEKSQMERYAIPLHGGKQPSADEKAGCLDSLRCKGIHERFAAITTAIAGHDFLFERPVYRNWLFEQRGLIWIKGPPGVGKSVLMKQMITRMERVDPKVLVAHFFIRYSLYDTPLIVMSSILHSLLYKFPTYMTGLAKTFRDREYRYGRMSQGMWSWKVKEIGEALQDVLIHNGTDTPICIWVDALDELGYSDDSGSELLEYFHDLAQQVEKAQAPVKICISSRDWPILGELDIPTVHVNHSGTRDEDLIRQRFVNRDSADLDETYKAVLTEGTDDEVNWRIKLLTWVLLSERPLTSYELREALAFDTDATCSSIRGLRSRPSWIKDIAAFEGYVMSLCPTLILFAAHEARIQPSDRTSLHNYFLRQLAGSIATPSGLDGQAEARLKIYAVCLRYLCLEDVRDSEYWNKRSLISTFPLAAYAAEYISRFEERWATKLEQWVAARQELDWMSTLRPRIQGMIGTLLQQSDSSNPAETMEELLMSLAEATLD
ncbi:hypothetical protein E8E13_001041 [Curvularia kusanoi]|uniref:HET-domain-containing protein n=1 Tax=Curvularia kusanoi TaxID=90978 RepID=A0A9P4W636_CURKU|nr:hypothetical protein E8E13_001041 [Curvularia kusanoi]